MRGRGIEPPRSLRPRRSERRVAPVTPPSRCAIGGTRTPTVFRPPAPQAGAATTSPRSRPCGLPESNRCCLRLLRPARLLLRHARSWIRSDSNRDRGAYEAPALAVELQIQLRTRGESNPPRPGDNRLASPDAYECRKCPRPDSNREPHPSEGRVVSSSTTRTCVRAAGFEPAVPGLEGQAPIQLGTRALLTEQDSNL